MKMYTTREVAEKLRYHPEHIRRLVREGKLKTANDYGHHKFTEKEIEDFLRGKQK